MAAAAWSLSLLGCGRRRTGASGGPGAGWASSDGVQERHAFRLVRVTAVDGATELAACKTLASLLNFLGPLPVEQPEKRPGDLRALLLLAVHRCCDRRADYPARNCNPMMRKNGRRQTSGRRTRTSQLRCLSRRLPHGSDTASARSPPQSDAMAAARGDLGAALSTQKACGPRLSRAFRIVARGGRAASTGATSSRRPRRAAEDRVPMRPSGGLRPEKKRSRGATATALLLARGTPLRLAAEARASCTPLNMRPSAVGRDHRLSSHALLDNKGSERPATWSREITGLFTLRTCCR